MAVQPRCALLGGMVTPPVAVNVLVPLYCLAPSVKLTTTVLLPGNSGFGV